MSETESRGGIYGKQAVLRYLDGRFEVVEPGDYVICAVTASPIPLSELCYWSVDLQEPYATSGASLARYLEVKGREERKR